MRIGLDAGFPDFLDHGVGGIVAIDVIDHDVGTGLPQCDRDALADSGIGARDQSLLTGQELVNRNRRRGRSGRG